MSKILIVDDMTGIRRSLSVILSGCGHEIVEAENGMVAYTKFTEHPTDLVITDILMPELDGIGLLTKLKKLDTPPKMIAISGGGNKVTAENALELAESYADIVIKKPFQREDILNAVQTALAS